MCQQGYFKPKLLEFLVLHTVIQGAVNQNTEIINAVSDVEREIVLLMYIVILNHFC